MDDGTIAGTTAGTVVAAVLEGSGYYTQAAILDTFEQFFHGIGAFIFVASCALGILFAVIYGNFRPMAPLILGPALFWFLIEYRVPLNPPAKQMGGGDAVDVTQALAASNTYAQQLQPAQVSWFFSITSRLASQMVNYVTNLIVQTENKQEVLFLAQKTSLSALLESQPSQTGLDTMFSYTMLQYCAPMLSALYNLSSEEFSDDHIAVLNGLISGGGPQAAAAGAALTDLQNRQLGWQDAFEHNATQVMITPDKAMKDFITRQTSMFVNAGQGINYEPILDPNFNGTPSDFITKDVPNLKLTCGQAMNVFGDAALDQGDWIAQFVVPGTLQGSSNDTAANEELICRAISDKIFQSYTYTSPCQLGGIAMIYLLKNLFSSDSINQAAQQIVNRSEVTDNSLSDKCRDPDRSTDLDELCTTINVSEPNPAWASLTQQNADDVEGVDGSKFSLKTSIVSYAYNIPYYQGLLLYFIATCFPFWAILVLIPSRASAFIYLPLAWFWVKSWDIGFALVYVLDELLWNILPSPKLLQDGYSSAGDLPSLLRNVSGVDMGTDLLAHYYFIAMCLISVPLLSGYAILRGRSEALSVIYRAPAIGSGLDGGQIDQLEYNSDRDLSSSYGVDPGPVLATPPAVTTPPPKNTTTPGTSGTSNPPPN